MKDILEQLKKINQILDKMENPVMKENRKLKQILNWRTQLCQTGEKNNISTPVLQK